MKLDYNKFTKILNKYKFFDSKSKVAVAVSGGPDSIARHVIEALDKRN